MSTTACSFATLMTICTIIAIVNITVPSWVTVAMNSYNRVGVGVWNAGWVFSNQSSIDFDGGYSDFLREPCTFKICKVPTQKLCKPLASLSYFCLIIFVFVNNY